MKKGFIFIETLIVLVVLLVTVIGMYSTYVKLSSNIENRKYYDNISDLYKTDIIRSYIDVSLLTSTSGVLQINKDNCTSFMPSSCSEVLNSLNVENIIINFEEINSLIESISNGLKNSTKEYLKTINSDGFTRYIIVNYIYNDKNYYASLKI